MVVYRKADPEVESAELDDGRLVQAATLADGGVEGGGECDRPSHATRAAGGRVAWGGIVEQCRHAHVDMHLGLTLPESVAAQNAHPR